MIMQRGRVLGEDMVWFPELEELRLAGVQLVDGRLCVTVAGSREAVVLALELPELAELFAACERALELAPAEPATGPEEPPPAAETEVPVV